MRSLVLLFVFAPAVVSADPVAAEPEPNPTDVKVARLMKAIANDRDSTRRGKTIEVLGEIGSPASPATRLLFEIAVDPKYRRNQLQALSAIEKISPQVYDIGRTLILDDGWFERADALKEIENLKAKDRAAIYPVVLKGYKFERARSKGSSFVLSDILRTMAAVYADEDETKAAFLETIRYYGPRFAGSGSRKMALELLDKVELDKKDLYKALISALSDPDTGAGALAVRRLGDLGADASPALETLRRLRFHKDEHVREAADYAVDKIESDK